MGKADCVPGLLKRWVATPDKRTRESHLRAHIRYAANPIPVSEPFVVGGARLRFPLDPNGPPGETINCRCRELVVHPAIGDGRLQMDTMVEAERKRRAEERKEGDNET